MRHLLAALLTMLSVITFCSCLNLNTAFNDKILPEKGVYEGSCWINVCSEPNYPYGDVTRYSVNFSVTLI